MPESYQPPLQKDDEHETTHSQSLDTNISKEAATVHKILAHKGGDVIGIRPDDTLGDAVQLLRDKGIGALIVTETDGALLGILSERDIVRKLADAPGRTLPHRVDEVMTKNVEVCSPTDDLVSVLRRMTDGRFRHMPVVEEGRLIGMVTIGDVVNYRLLQLEYEALQLKQLIVG
ncbi:CBS domain-containing protein [Hoeflea sp. WL0058]|uniref:CBS domain-containing protein n=1 Tax=Flavimaribacter sediminis TaxID=2865987 RepID=A0AAE3CZF3_9HYPH|nr:CBS domain-containing protein [Flavimaribacter sediminis]MBW8637220.1 CBS domain-containing protein [Flavimaribacter sediminis]